MLIILIIIYPKINFTNGWKILYSHRTSSSNCFVDYELVRTVVKLINLRKIWWFFEKNCSR